MTTTRFTRFGRAAVAGIAALTMVGAGVATTGAAPGSAVPAAAPAPAPAAGPAVSASADRAGCALPEGREGFRTADPAAHDLDPRAVADAIAFADANFRLNVRVFRDGCEVGASARNGITDGVPMEMFSATKSVVSLLAGIAQG